MRKTGVVIAVLLTGALAQASMPWQRTEQREPCARSTPFRAPYFGDLHIHTHFSADAYIFGTRIGPRDVYDFVRGTAIPVVDENEAATRSAQIDRPLDFAAVTDHAELFGEVALCDTPTSLVYNNDLCVQLREVEPSGVGQFVATVNWLFPLGIPNPPTNGKFCQDIPVTGIPGVDCDASAVSVWGEMQAAAEAAYDRTAACTFTSLLGYEYTASPIGRHLHRNVIFRNEHVPHIALSLLDTLDGGIPHGLWSAIEQQCLNAGTGCDAVIIPHNPNLSEGLQFFDPADAADALRRQTLEPLAEIHQIKGNSECRFDRLAGIGVGTPDELCTFEQQLEPHQGPDATVVPIPQWPRRNLLRPTLEDGLGFEQTLGVNPFRFGFVGATDTHNGTGGFTDESTWIGGQGNNDGSPELLIGDNMRTNPGGLTVAWAEENSRDAIFSAFKRRETYATSGTRPVVRFFAGELPRVTCGAADFVEQGYVGGTPMGGEMGPVRGRRSPRFAVWALKDPGTVDRPGIDLQRVQIIKGWVDAAGAPHERVFDVAGSASNGATVDQATCAPQGSGEAELCTTWEDPDFDASQRAFYYVRALENPVCRWSTHVCKQAGVDPFAADCAAQAAAAPAAFANCCLGPATDPFLDPTVQERAWTSPIWYRPEAIGRMRARVRFGRQAGHDAFVLRAALGRLPTTFDPVRDGLTVRVTDDDEIIAFVVPPNGFRRKSGGRYTFRADDGATVAIVRHGGSIVLTTRASGRDLSHAEREDHQVTVTLEGGTYRTEHVRRWRLRGDSLAVGSS